ncbi:ABC transporter ATP-binding protein [Rhodococcus sp. WMMA185]|uniref:ABC transporter ATP-binding protein n=1 Tax=Rhodococcus sp. WMMA185 TaxID=679318 RepID=UPI0008783E27|nr:ATP-binding cassette domain-containing protein [Rhodococcus sp. WMMA185]AOW91999.1 ABC transporter ATP-binding protein [Rhodococcus sp. WMMA185]
MTTAIPGSFAAPIEVRGLSKIFKNVQAVSDLSFSVPQGSITGLLGPNGSGKTTTLRMILGLVRPTSGTSTVMGLPIIELADPARTVGAVLGSQGLHPGRTALDHLTVYAAAIGVPQARALEVLSVVGLADAARRKAREFSPGMRQRLALATALLGDPQILVLDEPANGLDPDSVAWLREFLQGFAASGRTALISGHNVREVEQAVDDLVIVSRGVLVYQGRMDELRKSQQSRLLVACSNPPALAMALAANGVADTRSMADGRLAVAGAGEDLVRTVADRTGVAIFGTVGDQIDLEQLFLSMTAGHYVAGASAAAPSGYGPPQMHAPQAYPPQPWHGPPAYTPPPGHAPPHHGPHHQGPMPGGPR